MPFSFVALSFLLSTALACSLPRDGDSVGSTASAVTACATQTSVRGIDVSLYQGTIDWKAAYSGGVRFASMRLANDMKLDTTFDQNWEGSGAAGVIRGAYQFFNPNGDAKAQADLMITTLKSHGYGPGDLPPEIDVEWPDSKTNPLPAASTYATAVGVWVETIKKELGVAPILYTGGPYWDARVKSTAFADLPLWHAEYPGYYGPNDSRNTIYQLAADPLPRDGGCPTYLSSSMAKWSFWQFAGDNGRAPGVTGPVDLDVFNGSLDDLRALARAPKSDGDAGLDASTDAGSVSRSEEALRDDSEDGCHAGRSRSGSPTVALLLAFLLRRRRRGMCQAR